MRCTTNTIQMRKLLARFQLSYPLPPPPHAYTLQHVQGVQVVLPAGHAFPAGHWAVQVAEVNPVVLPYWPAGQGVHAVEAVPTLYWPAAHTYCDTSGGGRGHTAGHRGSPGTHTPLSGTEDSWHAPHTSRRGMQPECHEGKGKHRASSYKAQAYH
jgi:hypothetical protein